MVDKPEFRYKAARDSLNALGFESTLDYVKNVSQEILNTTSLIPHLNPGTMDINEIEKLKKLFWFYGHDARESQCKIMSKRHALLLRLT